MTPRDKAKELIDKHVYYVQSATAFGQLENAKACALITVEQIKHFHESLFYVNEGSLFDQYLNEVIEHINNYEL